MLPDSPSRIHTTAALQIEDDTQKSVRLSLCALAANPGAPTSTSQRTTIRPRIMLPRTDEGAPRLWIRDPGAPNKNISHSGKPRAHSCQVSGGQRDGRRRI